MSIRRHVLVLAILAAVVAAVPGAAQGPSSAPSASPVPAASSLVSPAPRAPEGTPLVGGPRWARVRDRAVRRSGMLEHAVTLGQEVIALAPITGRNGQMRVRVLASPDGSSWARRGAIPVTGDVADLFADDPALYAVGWDERAVIWRSDDAGRTWAAPADPAPFAGGADGLPALDEGAQVVAIARGPAGLLAVGSAEDRDTAARRAAAWRSTDGLAWERLVGAGALPPFHAVAGSADTYVVAGSTSTTATSPVGADTPVLRWSVDGAAWTDALADIRSGEAVEGVTAVPGSGFLAWGRDLGDAAAHAIVWSSPDGRAWTRRPDDPTLAGAHLAALRAVEGGALILAVGGAPRGAHVFTDIAGAWRRTTIRAGVAMCLRDVASVRAILVAVGGACGGARQRGRAWTSPLEP